MTNPATDPLHDVGVQASPSEGDGLAEAGSLGQMTYALNTSNGSPATGWPQFSADSVFSTAAVGDLYGTGSDDFVAGGASSNGFAFDTHYSNGGHVRIYNNHGGLICEANTNEEVDSSPAVGPVLSGNAYGIAVGTGSFFPGTSDEARTTVSPGAILIGWSRAAIRASADIGSPCDPVEISTICSGGSSSASRRSTSRPPGTDGTRR